MTHDQVIAVINNSCRVWLQVPHITIYSSDMGRGVTRFPFPTHVIAIYKLRTLALNKDDL